MKEDDGDDSGRVDSDLTKSRTDNKRVSCCNSAILSVP